MVWVACLRYMDLSACSIIVSVPVGIVLFALGPLELIPPHWYRLNHLVNALATAAFFVSIMFAAVAVSFELPWEKGARGAFFIVFWIVQLVVFYKIQPWMKRSGFHRLSEDRPAYSPPTDRQ